MVLEIVVLAAVFSGTDPDGAIHIEVFAHTEDLDNAPNALVRPQ